MNFHVALTDDEGNSWEDDFQVTVGIYGPHIRITQSIIDDDNNQQSKGNGDGVVNQKETIELLVEVRNDGDQTAYAVKGVLSTDDPYISIIDNSENFFDVPEGATSFT